MNKDVAEKWTDALLSGEYIQAKGALRTPNGFCCLGVLCDLYNKETGNGEWFNIGAAYCSFKSSEELCGGKIPLDVMDWAGMRTTYGSIKSEATTLSGMNDSGSNFRDIAEIIKKKAEEL